MRMFTESLSKSALNSFGWPVDLHKRCSVLRDSGSKQGLGYSQDLE